MEREIKTDIPNEKIKDNTENAEKRGCCDTADNDTDCCGNAEKCKNCEACDADNETVQENTECKDNADIAENSGNIDESVQEEQESESERYMRLMADFQNYKRRSEKERSDIYLFANEKIISELLTVADNFERALASADKNEGFVKGMEMIFDQLKDVMTKAGTEEIKALGEDFDPNFHNAVMTEDSSEYESGKVTEVLQKGYILNGRVIRPSMVKVAN